MPDLKTAKYSARFLLVVGSIILVLAAAEGFLRLFPNALGRRVAFLAFSGYNTLPGGMYFYEPITGMQFMRPNRRLRAYGHGYFWNHQSDRFGFRNPDGNLPKEILLLGDSFIYGHGVEESQTVSHFLRSLYGRPCYNMGQQGYCLYEEYVLARLYLAPFRPKVVILFASMNDFHDLLGARTAAQIESRPERNYDYAAVAASIKSLSAHDGTWLSRRLFGLCTVRLFYRAAAILLSTPVNTDLLSVAHADPFNPQRPESSLLDEARFNMAGNYYMSMLTDLKERCSQAGAELVIVHLEGPYRMSKKVQAQSRLELFLRRYAKGAGMRFFATPFNVRNCPDCYLPEDGHFTEKGHRLLAQFLNEQIL